MTYVDVSDLKGLAPDDDPKWVRMIVDEIRKGGTWNLTFDYDPDKPQVADTLSRHSAAGSCLKRAALIRDGVEQEPMDDAGLWVTFLGTMAHTAWQNAGLTQVGDHFLVEQPSTLGDLTSGSCDALVEGVLELKTTGGSGYKYMVGAQGKAQGPKSPHLVQLALNVMGHDAAFGTLVYLSTEAISKGAAQRKGFDETIRYGAQWTFPREHLQPLADEWLEQLAWVRDHDTDEVPRFWPHEMPKGATIVNPSSAAWELSHDGEVFDEGKVWSGQGCMYCPVQEACEKLLADGR